MARIKVENLIHVELEKLEDKVNEFQKYLQINPIITTVNRQGNMVRIDEAGMNLEQQDLLHKEIIIQIKMQDALFNWMPLLLKLREEVEGAKIETHGDVKVNGMFKKR